MNPQPQPDSFSVQSTPVRSCLSGLLLTFLLALSGCGDAAGSADSPEAPQSGGGPSAAPPPALVRVQPVVEEPIAPKLLAIGTVTPRHMSIVASASDGIVDEFLVEHGDFVKADTVLSRLRMKSTDLALEQQRQILAERQAAFEETQTPRRELVEEAKARQLAAQAAASKAERRLRELQQLSERGAANESFVRDSEDEELEAKQKLLAAKALYELVSAGARTEAKLQAKARLDAQTTYVEFLEAEKDKRTTRAPFDGYVVEEHTFNGQWLAKGDAVVTLAQLDEVDVEVQVDQAFVRQIQMNDRVSVRIPGTHREWEGHVRSVVPRAEWKQGSRSFPVLVAITNEFENIEGMPIPALREGMMAEAQFAGDQKTGILVPKDALVRTSNGTFVFVVNPEADGEPTSVRRVQVEPGISDESRIQVLNTDLQAGMLVVVEGAERLRPFQSISILPEDDGNSADANQSAE